MALQDAATARATSDIRNPMNYDSVTIGELNASINSSDGEVILIRVTEGESGSKEIVQTDGSKINLLDTIAAIKAKNYDVSYVFGVGKVTIFVRF